MLALTASLLALAHGAPLWSRLAAESALGPAPRLGAAALGTPSALLQAGGCSSSCCYAPLTDMWVFSSGAWANVSQTSAPPGRLYQGTSPAGVTADSYYVFGGNDIDTGMLDELYLVRLALNSTPPAATWIALGSGGSGAAPWPPARASHSQSALPGGSGAFLVFGGEDSNEEALGDAWAYTPQGNRGAWARVDPAAGAPAPSPRSQHAALPLALGSGARAVLVSGGMDSDGVDNGELWALAVDAAPPQWLLLGNSSAGAGPAARHGHALWGSAAAAGAAPGAFSLELLLYGGQNSSIPDPANFLGDTWRFQVGVRVGAGGALALAGEGRFELLDAGRTGGPGPRSLGVYASQGPQLVYAGGFAGYNGGTDDRLFNDVWAAAA